VDVGWEALGQWGDDVTRIEPLTGGIANQVWSVRVNGQLAVGRLGVRSDADLTWETELLTAPGGAHLVRCRRHDDARRPEAWPKQSYESE